MHNLPFKCSENPNNVHVQGANIPNGTRRLKKLVKTIKKQQQQTYPTNQITRNLRPPPKKKKISDITTLYFWPFEMLLLLTLFLITPLGTTAHSSPPLNTSLAGIFQKKTAKNALKTYFLQRKNLEKNRKKLQHQDWTGTGRNIL